MSKKEFYFWWIWFVICAIGGWFFKLMLWGIIIPIARRTYLEALETKKELEILDEE